MNHGTTSAWNLESNRKCEDQTFVSTSARTTPELYTSTSVSIKSASVVYPSGVMSSHRLLQDSASSSYSTMCTKFG